MIQDIFRPIYGTFMLQPLTLCWCLWSNVDYWSNLGPFTIFSTIYLIPVYMVYEKLWELKEEFDE